MCGITGIYGLGDKELIKKMTSVISYRGPDDHGYYIDKNISLGHRRLSIIDLSEKGKQPMHNEDNTIQIVYNGEIYNYKELKEDLEKKGHKFYSNTDTEVIIHAYEQYKENCLNYFRGMFAFAIYDRNEKKLFLARDRLGIKPLYYTLFDNKLIFASEIKSILQYPEFKREVDLTALANFLTFRFVLGPRTMFKNIKKLQPGHYLIYKDNNIKIEKYWDISYNPKKSSLGYFKKNILNLIEEAVRIRLMSDVPLGAYISGGIDSGTVTYFMNKYMDEPVKTFSVGFGLQEHRDELKYARIIADYFNTQHREIIVKPETIKVLPKVVWHFDEPIADPAAIPTYLLSKIAKDKVTVVLTGEGGDELFAGYEQYKIIKLGKKIKRFPPVIRNYLPSLLPKLAKKIPTKLLDKIFKYSAALGEEGTKRFADFLNKLENPIENYLSLIAIFNENERKEILKENQKLEVDFSPLYPKKDWISGISLFEFKTELPDNLLMKVDKMTMAHAVEARVPFLDHKLVEFSTTIPSKLKLKGLTEKYILKKAMKDKLPKEIIKRKKERFFVPIDLWFSKDRELREIALNLLSENAIKREGYFDYRYIEKIFKNYKNSKLYYARQLWNLLNFELWHKLYIERGFIYNPNLNKDISL